MGDCGVPSSSVILHVDLDSFYAAVEQVRLGLPREQPLAVQQWESLIAVNYAARASGVARHDRVSEAVRKCPDLHLVHVETIGSDDGRIAAASRGSAKVSLERYRQASSQVFEIFHCYADICERASIDEAYLDVTNKVDEMIQKGCDWDSELHHLLSCQSYDGNVSGSEKGAMIIEDGPLSICNITDRRLLAGAIIAAQIRFSTRTELGYTCSVGIATNKLLAKIASARHKPDQQTLILPRSVPGLMQTLPLRKIKLLGGKIGEELAEKWNCTNAGEVQSLPLATLVSCFGDRLGHYVWKAVRGIQEDKVQEKQIPKSMLAAKSFQATSDLLSIRKWLGILAEELSMRMLHDARKNHRQPHALQLYYRCGSFQQNSDHSKSCSMPPSVLHLLSAAAAWSTPSELPTASLKGPPSRIEEHSRNFLENGVDEAQDSVLMTACGLEDRGGQQQDVKSGRSGDATPLPCERIEKTLTETTKELAKLLQEASFRLFQRIEGPFPCMRLAIAASGYQEWPAQGNQSIEHFFANASPVQASILSEPAPAIRYSMVKDCPVEKPRGLFKYISRSASNSKQMVSSFLNDETIDQETSKSNYRGSQAHNSQEQVASLCYSHDTVGFLQSTRIDNQSDAEGGDAMEYKVPTVCHGMPHQLMDMPITLVSEPHKADSFLAGKDDTGSQTVVHENQTLEEISESEGLQGGTEEELDLTDVDVEEQHQILQEIYKSQSISKAGCDYRSRENQAPKRRKRATCKPGQTPILKFFHST